MIIRSAGFRDRNEIESLLKQRGIFHEKEIAVAVQVLEDALEETERGEYFAFCGFDGTGRLLGYICFGPITMTDDCYDLYWIAVDQCCARRGVGEELLTFMEECLADKEARRVYVDTSSTNAYAPARNFYEKHGYERVGILEDFYRDGDHRIIYVKEVGHDEFSKAKHTKTEQDSLSYR